MILFVVCLIYNFCVFKESIEKWWGNFGFEFFEVWIKSRSYFGCWIDIREIKKKLENNVINYFKNEIF